MPIVPGSRINHFEILSLLGTGGMGEVYRARDLRLGREVALKVLPPEAFDSPERLGRFDREARAASALNHPNIVTIYEIGSADRQQYIAMELVEGSSLRELIALGSVAVPRALRIATQIAEALARAHSAGVVHRDLKPENVMLTPDGLVKVLDFGIAKLEEWASHPDGATATAATQAGVVLGTTEYMSPEQARGLAVDFRSDLFALGVLISELVTGRHPFRRDTPLQTLLAVIEQPAATVVDLPAPVQAILDRCLAKTADARYPSSVELVRDLRDAADRTSSGRAVPAGRARRPRPAASLGVLPFVNEGADPDLEYLSDGISETIINALSPLPRLKVMARSTMFRYRGKSVDPQRVGRELDVGAVLTGRMLHRGGRLHVSVELVDVLEGSQLWGKQYDREFSEVSGIQEEIAQEISEHLKLKLSAPQKKRLAKRFTSSPEAFRTYLKGRYFWNKRTPDGIRKGIALFHQAIELDPTFARAYAGIADSYALLSAGEYGVMPPRESMLKARAAAERALELDDQLAEAHCSLAFSRFWFDWNWAEAEREFTRALELNPGYSIGEMWYSDFLAAMGRFPEAEAHARRAQELDPLSAVPMVALGRVLYFARRFEEALQEFRRSLELDPTFVRALLMSAVALANLDRPEEALAAVDRAIAASGGSALMLSVRGQIAARGGRRQEAVAVLHELDARARDGYVSSYNRAAVYATLGELDAAFEWLERAYDERSSSLVYLRVSPLLENVRRDARFDVLQLRIDSGGTGTASGTR